MKITITKQAIKEQIINMPIEILMDKVMKKYNKDNSFWRYLFRGCKIDRSAFDYLKIRTDYIFEELRK